MDLSWHTFIVLSCINSSEGADTANFGPPQNVCCALNWWLNMCVCAADWKRDVNADADLEFPADASVFPPANQGEAFIVKHCIWHLVSRATVAGQFLIMGKKILMQGHILHCLISISVFSIAGGNILSPALFFWIPSCVIRKFQNVKSKRTELLHCFLFSL